MKGFDHVDTWVFDLDNTLYPASCRLFDQIDVKMGEFVSRLLGIEFAEAKRRQKELFYRHGTTLRGLMVEHGVPPDGFLDYVHDIDHSPVPPNKPLDDALHALPGRKLIFTALAWAIGFVIFFPILWTIITSFKTEGEAVTIPPHMPTQWTTLPASPATNSDAGTPAVPQASGRQRAIHWPSVSISRV